MKTLRSTDNALQSCETVVSEFLAPWKRRRNVEGAMLVGSYATGLNTPMSDVDICVVLSGRAKYWKRGNVMLSGKLVEYAIYPITYIKDLQATDLREGMRLRMRMFATGIILFDKFGTLVELQKEARLLLKRRLPSIDTETMQKCKYLLWDQLDNLRDLWQRGAPGFSYAYYVGLQEILRFYAAFLRLEVPRATRIHPVITSKEFCAKYGIKQLPDEYFCALFAEAMQEPSLQMFECLTDHVQKKSGGFLIDGWTLSRRLP